MAHRSNVERKIHAADENIESSNPLRKYAWLATKPFSANHRVTGLPSSSLCTHLAANTLDPIHHLHRKTSWNVLLSNSQSLRSNSNLDLDVTSNTTKESAKQLKIGLSAFFPIVQQTSLNNPVGIPKSQGCINTDSRIICLQNEVSQLWDYNRPELMVWLREQSHIWGVSGQTCNHVELSNSLDVLTCESLLKDNLGSTCQVHLELVLSVQDIEAFFADLSAYAQESSLEWFLAERAWREPGSVLQKNQMKLWSSGTGFVPDEAATWDVETVDFQTELKGEVEKRHRCATTLAVLGSKSFQLVSCRVHVAFFVLSRCR